MGRTEPELISNTLLRGLNQAQIDAVTHSEGPLLVIAGPGSGKTRVLTHRVAYLIKGLGVPPFSILAVTFTNKAAEEMRSRLGELIGPHAEQVAAGTFHATCARILRREAEYAGFGRDYAIFDTSDQSQVLRACLKELDLAADRFEVRGLAATISKSKNELVMPEEYRSAAKDAYAKTVARVYELYQQKLKECNALDFDDLLVVTVRLMRENPDVVSRYQERFQHILVDEYQDTNRAQYILVRLLAGQGDRITVVGDEMQSIYGFRGADIRNILSFTRDYPHARLIRLEQNYRSTKNILEAANCLIAKSRDRMEKKLWTENPRGERILFFRADDERREAAFVAEEIAMAVSLGLSYRDFAVLYRTHVQSRAIEEEFVRRGVPYRIVSGLRFYERKEIKDLIAYLRLIQNPRDNLSFRRIVNVPRRGIGEVSLAKLEAAAGERNFGLLDAILSLPQEELGVGRSAYSRLVEFGRLIQGLAREEAERTSSLAGLISGVLERTGYMDELLADKSLEAQARVENLREFSSSARNYEQESGESDLPGFLERLALVSDSDAYDPSSDVVNLMTIHAVKGLEFPVVFIVGMEEGIFPHARAAQDGDVDEERRLAYVGVTRAKERLYLTCAHVRTIYGYTDAQEVSRFVTQMPAKYLKDLGLTASFT
ncbi:MAG: UvrD-helicase domain-containing protein [Firmicutes bacterium]|nr:UvrD-helicase domain-containing protein [Bacillota bacterium]